MIGRFLVLAAGIIVVSAGVAGIASLAPDAAAVNDVSTSDDNGNWTRRDESQQNAASTAVQSSGEVRLDRSSDSHFYTDASIDGTDIRMLVDSGASLVALTRADAEAIGINVDGLPQAGFAQTAGGRVLVRPVMLDSIAVDGIEVRHVPAAVIDVAMPSSLLGQSFLARLDAMKIEGDVMTLR